MNVLFLTHRLPYAPNRGDRVRAYHLLREISQWASVDLISVVHDDEEASHAGDMRDVARSVAVARPRRFRNLVQAGLALPTSKPTTHSLLQSPEMDAAVDRVAAVSPPDLVLCYCTGVAPAIFRPALKSLPVVLDMVDVDSAKWSALAPNAKLPLSWIYGREGRVLRRYEAMAMERAAVTLVVNDREREVASDIAPAASVAVIENGVDLKQLRPAGPPAREPVVVFCGVMNYTPNVEGAVWLARKVWPHVRRQRPDARLEIVGAQPARVVRALESATDGIHVTGSVPDVRPHLWRAAVGVAPLQTARGVQNKVLEAVAAGLPVVVTPAVMEGLPLQVTAACRTAETAEKFAAEVAALLDRDPEDRRRLADSTDLDALAWASRLRPLRALVEKAAQGASAGRPGPLDGYSR